MEYYFEELPEYTRRGRTVDNDENEIQIISVEEITDTINKKITSAR